MILDSELPLYLWPEAINMAVEILNRLPIDALAGEVPYTLQAFSDASFAMVQSKHSQSGFVCFAAGGPIAWYSSKQPIITLSSIEAEYVGLVTAA